MTTDRLTPAVLWLGMFGALLISLLIVAANLNPPTGDVQLLFVFMAGSGTFSVLLVWLLQRTGTWARLRSLRWGLFSAIGLLVLLIILNVWLTAQLMFISEHDFILTMALLIFAGMVGLLCVMYLAGAWIQRIERLAVAAKALQAGGFDARIVVSGRDELAQLEASFNQMISGLEALETQKRALDQERREWIAWVSHDLRTPLATLRAMNEALLDGVVSDPATIQRYMHTAQREIFHLSALIDDLFDLAQVDAGKFTLRREPASLRDLLSDILGGMAARAHGHGIHLEGDIAPGLDLVPMESAKIQRVLHNLLDNALRHTPQGGSVTLRAQTASNGVEICVHNTGEAIPEQDLPHIFERFYRGEPSRAQRDGTRGTGLGLAIAHALVEAHGGSIGVVSSAGQGTTFTVRLPLT